MPPANPEKVALLAPAGLITPLIKYWYGAVPPVTLVTLMVPSLAAQVVSSVAESAIAVMLFGAVIVTKGKDCVHPLASLIITTYVFCAKLVKMFDAWKVMPSIEYWYGAAPPVGLVTVMVPSNAVQLVGFVEVTVAASTTFTFNVTGVRVATQPAASFT